MLDLNASGAKLTRACVPVTRAVNGASHTKVQFTWKKTRKLHVKHRYRRSHVKNGVKKEVSKSPSRALPEAGASGPLRL